LYPIKRPNRRFPDVRVVFVSFPKPASSGVSKKSKGAKQSNDEITLPLMEKNAGAGLLSRIALVFGVVAAAGAFAAGNCNVRTS